MHRIVELGLKFRLLIIALALGIIIVGILQLRNMPIDTLPEFSSPYIQVQTEALGLSESEVEELVTFNLEELLSGLSWLQSIRSTSIPGLSSIFLFFEPGTDIIRARQLVNERLSLAYTLPNVAQVPVIIQPLSAMSRVMMVGLSSKELSPTKMSVQARWTIQPALLSVPGVANVAIWGLRDQQLQVQVDPKTLQSKHISLDKIISTAGDSLWVSPLSFLNASTPGSGGWIETPQQRIEVRHVSPIITPKDLAQVRVEDSSVHLGDVANLVEGHQPLIGDSIIHNDNGLIIVIEKFPGADTLTVTRGIEEKLRTLQPGLSGIQINTIFRPATFIESQIFHNGSAIIIGLVLLTIFVFLVFYSFRAVIISLMSIIVSLSVGVILLNLFDVTLNMMVFAGLLLAIAIIVDNAIFNIANMMHRFSNECKKEEGKLARNIILDSTSEMFSSVIYATFIIVLILLPIFFLSGLSGIFLRSIALAYTFVILASIVVALLVTPALSFLLLSGKSYTWPQHNFLRKLKNGYSHIIDKIIRTISPANLTIGAVVISIIVLLGFSFLFIRERPLVPDFKEQIIMIQWEGPPGTSAIEMNRITTMASQELSSISGVSNVSAIIGRAILGDKLANVNSAEFILTINPNVNYKKTMAAIQKVVDGYPGIYHVVQTYLKETIRRAITESNSDLVVRIYGPDLSVLQKEAEKIKDLIASKIENVTDVHVEQLLSQPQINIEVNLAKAKHYGLKPGDVRRAASTSLAGIEVGSLFQEQKVFPVVVWGTPEIRHSIDSIRDLLIETPNGQWVRLADVANVTVNPTFNLVEHENVSRRIDVSLKVLRGTNINMIANKIKQALNQIKFPLEYRAVIFDSYQSLHWSYNHFVALILATLIIIFLLLQAAFGSFLLAAVIFLVLPAALLGSILIAFAINSISYASLLGLIAVYGLAAQNSIKLIKYYQYLEENKHKPVCEELIKQGATDQFAPILIAAVAVCVLFVPFAVIVHLSGVELISPLILVMLGGTMTSTLLTLFVVPFLYLWVCDSTGGNTPILKETKVLEEEDKERVPNNFAN